MKKYDKIDWEQINPMEAFRISDKETKEKIIKLWIFKIRKDNEEAKLIIPSFLCTINKNDKIRKDYYPFYHQVFWFLLLDLKDIKFALSDLEMICKNMNQYTFPNWAMIQLIK